MAIEDIETNADCSVSLYGRVADSNFEQIKSTLSDHESRLDALDAGTLRITTEGGIGVLLTNKTGAATVKGTVVKASAGTDNAFDIAGSGEAQLLGVVYTDGVADGSSCLVIILGLADVLLENDVGSTRGNWVRVSTTAAGRADASLAAPPGGGIPELDAHMNELGHCLQTVAGSATGALCRCLIHLN